MRDLTFVPELLGGIFEELAGRAGRVSPLSRALRGVRLWSDASRRAVAKDAVRRPKGFPDDLDLIASDGSILEALPRMVWALPR